MLACCPISHTHTLVTKLQAEQPVHVACPPHHVIVNIIFIRSSYLLFTQNIIIPASNREKKVLSFLILFIVLLYPRIEITVRSCIYLLGLCNPGLNLGVTDIIIYTNTKGKVSHPSHQGINNQKFCNKSKTRQYFKGNNTSTCRQ